MNDIIEPTIDYDFSNLYLGPPSTIAGGAYFTRIMYNNNKQLYIQTPKSLTKQGFVKSGKKIYVDLMFDNNDTVFINWIENLEAKCQELIFSKGENWFQTKLDKDDIDTAFTSPFKIYKSGKYYLLRVNVKPNVKIFNDNATVINLDDIAADKTLISIIEIQGIKFTSRNFQMELELKQSMIVSPDPFLDACFIKTPVKKQSSNQENIDAKDLDAKDLDIDVELDAELDITSDGNKEDLGDTHINLFERKNADINKVNVNLNATELQSFSKDENIDIDKKTEINTAINSKTTTASSASPILQLEEIHNIDLNSLKENTNDNIVLEIEDLNLDYIKKEDPNILKEFDLSSSLENDLESITLKKPNQVYYEIYKKAREKAKEAKKEAIQAFLEAKNIKKTYMLDDIDESDQSDFEDFSINENDDF
jgi:hypothetical protein